MQPSQERIISKLYEASEVVGLEITEFIDFILVHNPDIDRTTATLVAISCLRSLRTSFLEEPQLMQQLKAIATKLSQA